MNVDPQTVIGLIRDAAERHILPRFRKLEKHEISTKSSPRDLVTVADLETERALTPVLRDLVPGSHVVGEEAVAHDPASLDAIQRDDAVWIIDPVDGTANFVDAVPRFAVLVALAVGGQVRMGWIHDPIRAVTAWATAGEGAWLEDAAGQRTRMRRRDPGPLGQLAGSSSGRFGERGRMRDLLEAHRPGPIQMLRSAGQEYLALAEGNLDYAIFGRTLPWDHAAGAVVYQEAGGVLGFIDADKPPPLPFSPRRHIGPLLAAPTPELWSTLRGFIVG